MENGDPARGIGEAPHPLASCGTGGNGTAISVFQN